MENWHVLAVTGVVFVILEIFTPSFFMLPAGVAFLVTAAISPLLPDLTSIIGVLAVSLLVVYGICYRFIWPRLSKTTGPRTNASGMIGKVAFVTERVLPDGSSGYVKLYGDRWRALGDEIFEVGQRVVITQIDGNKVIVGRPPVD